MISTSGNIGLILESKPQQGMRPVDVQLCADVGSVVVYGAVVNMQLLADLSAGLALGEQAEDPPLRRRQVA